ncbi:MAG: hypothetical protein KIT75_03510 [Planctomycetota bacterium]|nr:hypothetical protein [Planctomycetota bacterium]
MFEQAKADWLAALADPSPVARINQRLLLKAHGSEFGYRRVYEPAQIGVSSGLSRTEILGPAVAETSGKKRLLVPNGFAAVIEEINYHYREASGGSLGSNIPASVLELQLGGEVLSRFPAWRLDAFHKGAGGDGLMFGAIPLSVWLENGKAVQLYLTGGGGSDSMDVRVSLTVRFEPLWLMQAAGLVNQHEPA